MHPRRNREHIKFGLSNDRGMYMKQFEELNEKERKSKSQVDIRKHINKKTLRWMELEEKKETQ